MQVFHLHIKISHLGSSNLDSWSICSAMSSDFRVWIAKHPCANAISSFFGVTTLSYKIACITREHIITYFALAPFTDSYHFRNLTKMIIYIDSLRFTRIYRSSDCCNEIFPASITKQFLQVSGEPDLNLFFSVITIYIFLNSVK